MAHLGVDAVGEIHRRRALAQPDHLALGGQHEDLVLEQLGTEGFQDTPVVLVLAFQQAAQGIDAVVQNRVLPAALLVAPVGGHPVLGEGMHGFGADLDLHRPALLSQHHGMQGLVAVILGIGDVIVEFLGDVQPAPVDQAQDGIAGGHVVHDDPHRVQVVELLQGHFLAHHLPVDAVDVLGPAEHPGMDAGFVQFLPEFVYEVVDEAFALGPVGRQGLGQPPILLGVEVAEGQVLQFPFQLSHAQPVGQGGEEIQRLQADAVPKLFVFVLDQPQPLQPVGELHQHRPHIVHHGQQHAAQEFRLIGLLHTFRPVLVKGVEPIGLLHQVRHRVSEAPPDFFGGQIVPQVRVAEQRHLYRDGIDP